MKWRRNQMQRIDSDIQEARRLREEAVAERAAIVRESNLVTTVIERRKVDGFGDQVQVTFTRREAE